MTDGVMIRRFWRSLQASTTFTETETSRVIRAFKAVQPDFDQHYFLKEVANYIIADLLEAYLSADVKSLKEWGTEGVLFILVSLTQSPIFIGVCAHDCRV